MYSRTPKTFTSRAKTNLDFDKFKVSSGIRFASNGVIESALVIEGKVSIGGPELISIGAGAERKALTYFYPSGRLKEGRLLNIGKFRNTKGRLVTKEPGSIVSFNENGELL